MRVLRMFLFLAVLIFSAQSALAAGFGIYEWSARGIALGGAMVARADDPSALAYNPAGITQLDGLQFQSGVSFIMPSADIKLTDPYSGQTKNTSANSNAWIVPHMYATYKLAPKVSMGLAAYSRFGMGNDYSEGWWGRYGTYNTSLQTYSFAPSIAVKITDKISLGLGVEIMKMDIDMRQTIDGTKLMYAAAQKNAVAAGGTTAMGTAAAQASLRRNGLGTNTNDPRTTDLDYDQTLKGSGVGVGGNLSLHYKINDQWSAGFLYRSRIETHIQGRASITMSDRTLQYMQALKTADNRLFRNSSVTATITTPDSFALGVAFSPMPNLSIEVGAIYTLWSTYDEIDLGYNNPSNGVNEVKIERHWNDVFRYNVGVEYSPVEWLALRAGYVFDQSPIEESYEDYSLPSNDRHLFNFGLGFKYADFTADTAYTYLHMTDRKVDANIDHGVLQSTFKNGCAHIVSFTLGYAFN